MTRVTLKDVAAHAGVSHQTVSNVLNDHPSIRPATRERVLRSITALDYHPNLAAKALREARITTICCALYDHDPQNLGDPYRNLVQAAVIAEANAHGYSVTTAILDGRREEMLGQLRQRFKGRQFCGTVIVGNTVTPAQWREMDDWGMRCVLVDHHLTGTDALSVSADYQGGMAQLVAHHAARGRRHLALVLPPDRSGSTTAERRVGFLAAAAAQGLRASEANGDWSFESGHAAMHRLWAASGQGGTDRPDAVLAGNDRMAAGVLRAAHELGLNVPQDIAVSGFDDFEFAQYTTPTLTTVRIPHGDMARQSVRSLLSLLGDQPAQSRVFSLPLVVRESA